MTPLPEGRILLPIARATIATELGQSLAADESADWLHNRGACFVTLTENGQLRGCIGTVEAYRSLLDDVKSNAVAAALHDPRFPPLRLEELALVDIEVSLLSPMQELTFNSEREALAQLRPNIDGVVLEYGRFRSTFLPQVWEQLPKPAEFMAHLKYKAGLSPAFWVEGVKLYRYTVDKWKEHDLEGAAT